MTDVIERTLELEQPVADVWRALTDPTELSAWFGDTAELNPSPGGVGWFGWDSHGRFAVRVEEFEPERRFVWSWAHEPNREIDEVPTTKVEWTLTPRPDGGTTLHLRESGFLTLAHHRENTEGWEQELGHLVAHLDRRS